MGKNTTGTEEKIICYHCGDYCENDHVVFDDKDFCCNGCKTVFEILNENDLCTYYDLEKNPGINLKSKEFGDKYNYLENKEIQKQLLDFNEGTTAKVNFYIPSIHCSSCIWLLENLYKLKDGIRYSRVNFTKKEVNIDFNPEVIPLKEMVESLSTIGYEPYISLDQESKKKFKSTNKSLLMKIGVAGFCFGNIMLLSFPEYFGFEGIDDLFIQRFISWLNLFLALPVVFYCSTDYFKSAWSGFRQNYINIDVPISLGILSLFIVSLFQVGLNNGPGYLDSLAGLLFFLLIGRWVQNKTYEGLSFERDYRSYFPLAVNKIINGISSPTPVKDLVESDIITIRNNEIIPADSILISDSANIDYSFVTGEAVPVTKEGGSFIYAGGKQLGQLITLEVKKPVSQSYLTQLWNNEAFRKEEPSHLESLVNKISKYFTLLILGIAIAGLIFWLNIDSNKAWFVLTSVLIVACPCALALSTPFTLGNTMNVFGRKRFYIKNPHVIEKLTRVTHIVFDKTGTLTNNRESEISYIGDSLKEDEKLLIKALLSNSTHPLSRKVYNTISLSESGVTVPVIKDFIEIKGKGISGKTNNHALRIGSAELVADGINGKRLNEMLSNDNSRVYINIDGVLKGYYRVSNKFRSGLNDLIENLSQDYKLSVLSGDNEGEKSDLLNIFGEGSIIKFNQKPEDKLTYIANLQKQGENVLMLGDGLNDAGALIKSDIGIAVTEDITSFTPASDAIIDGSKLTDFNLFLSFSKTSRRIIILSFIISFLYNVIGMSFALSGLLTPIIAAILMPVSSISVVFFATFAVNSMARTKKLL